MSTTSGRDGRSSGGEILHLRELVDMQVTDAMWGEIIRTLAETAAEGEKGAIQAAKLLLAYRYGLPNQVTGAEELHPIHIRTIEARLSERKPTRKHRAERRGSKTGAEPAPGTVEGVAVEKAIHRRDGGDTGR